LDVAFGIDVNVATIDGNVVVSQIILHCRSPIDGSGDRTVVFGGGGGDGAGGFTCPEHTFMVGFVGRAGDFIDALGITCRGPHQLWCFSKLIDDLTGHAARNPMRPGLRSLNVAMAQTGGVATGDFGR
jgi:hypothetical protein